MTNLSSCGKTYKFLDKDLKEYPETASQLQKCYLSVYIAYRSRLNTEDIYR